MSKRLDEQEVAVARVYARSALALAESEGQAESLLEEIEELAALVVRDAGVERFFGSPLVEGKARAEALERALRGRASDLLVNTLQVMNRKGRLELVPALAEAYHQELEELRGRVEVEVETAVPLGEAQRARLREAIVRFTGRQPDVSETVDPSLLAGMVVRVGDRKIDTSAAKEIRRLKARLMERAAAEIHAGRTYFEEAR